MKHAMTIPASRRIMRPRSRVRRYWPIVFGAVVYLFALALALALQGLP